MSDMAVARSGQVRPLQKEDISSRDARHSKRRRLIDLARSWPGAAEYHSKSMECIVPPDWGRELYSWLAAHDGGTGSDIAESEESSDDMEGEDSQLGVVQTLPTKMKGPARLQASPYAIETSEAPGHTVDASHTACNSNSTESSAGIMFPSPTSNNGLHTSISEDNSIEPTKLASGGKSPQDLTYMAQRSTSPLLSSTITRRKPKSPQHPTQELSFQPVPAGNSRSVPQGCPTSWAEAHPADKMMVCMRGEGHNWCATKRRWKEMTGYEADTGTLKRRFGMLKKGMGLITDEDIEHVLLAEATVRSKANSRETGVARPPTESTSRHGSNQALNKDTLHPRCTFLLNQQNNSDNEASQGSIEMVFEAQPRSNGRKAVNRTRPSSSTPSCVLHREGAVLVQGRQGLEHMTGRVRCDAGAGETCQAVNHDKTKLNFVTDTKMRMLRVGRQGTERETKGLDEEDGRLDGPGRFDEESVLSAFAVKTAAGDTQCAHNLISGPPEPRLRSQHGNNGTSTKWVTLKLPSRRILQGLPPSWALPGNDTSAINIINRSMQQPTKYTYSKVTAKRPTRSVRTRLYLRPPRLPEPSRVSTAIATPRIPPFFDGSRGGQAAMNSRSLTLPSSTPNITSPQRGLQKEPRYIGATVTSDQARENPDMSLQARLKDRKKRPNVSRAMIASWARRRPEDGTGVYGGLRPQRRLDERRKQSNRSLAITAWWARRRVEGRNGRGGGPPKANAIKDQAREENANSTMQARSRDEKRRRNRSLAMKALWARRRAECRNEEHGELSRASAIMQVQREATKVGPTAKTKLRLGDAQSGGGL